jgi:hypothetical protein
MRGEIMQQRLKAFNQLALTGALAGAGGIAAYNVMKYLDDEKEQRQRRERAIPPAPQVPVQQQHPAHNAWDELPAMIGRIHAQLRNPHVPAEAEPDPDVPPAVPVNYSPLEPALRGDDDYKEDCFNEEEMINAEPWNADLYRDGGGCVVFVDPARHLNKGQCVLRTHIYDLPMNAEHYATFRIHVNDDPNIEHPLVQFRVGNLLNVNTLLTWAILMTPEQANFLKLQNQRFVCYHQVMMSVNGQPLTRFTPVSEYNIDNANAQKAAEAEARARAIEFYPTLMANQTDENIATMKGYAAAFLHVDPSSIALAWPM